MPAYASCVRLATLATFVCLLILFCWEISKPQYRYRLYQGQYQFTYGDTGPIDALAIGSSRSQTAFQSDIFARETKCPDGKKIIVYDYSKSLPGLGFHYTMLRDAFGKHQIRRVYVEYKQANIYMPVHPYCYQIATFGDLWEGTVLASKDAVFERGRTFLRLALKKIVNELALWILRRPALASDPLDRPATVRDLTSPQLIVSQSIQSYSQLLGKGDKWRTYSDAEFSIGAPMERRSTYFLRRIIELSRENGADVVAHHIPVLFQNPIGKGVIRQWSDQDRMPIYQLPMRLRTKIYMNGFGDAGHMNRRGAMLYMGWLAGTSGAQLLCH